MRNRCHKGGDIMSWIVKIFNACASIMRETIDLFGYEVSLMQVLVYGFLMLIVFKILSEVM